jgi:hypothetical protein
MVYSRDLFISYGADTVLILGGDTLAATSSIISSVLSDGVTITGDGTTGSELTVDTATVIATKQDLDLYYLDSNPDGYTSNTGTVTSVGGTGTVNGISLSGTVTSSGDLTLVGTLSGVDLATQVTGTLPVANGGTGATSFTSGRVLFGNGTSAINTDGDLFWDNTNKRLGIGTDSPDYKLDVDVSTDADWAARVKNTSSTGYGLYVEGSENNSQYILGLNNGLAYQMVVTGDGNVGIGTSSPSQKLEVNGKVKIGDLTGTGGNAVYENGGVLGVASDSRFKSYIGDIDNGIQKVLDLRPKYFVDNRNSTFQQLGFYAQEVKSIINEASYPIGNTDYLGINDRAIIAVTVKAIQEQQAIIESQATEIETLKSQIQLILNEIEQLKNN